MLISSLAYCSTLKMEAASFPKFPLVFSGLLVDIYQKIELFITSDVRKSDPVVINVCKMSEENMYSYVKYYRTILFAAFLGPTLLLHASVWFYALL
jgi:hypothetical protein